MFGMLFYLRRDESRVQIPRFRCGYFRTMYVYVRVCMCVCVCVCVCVELLGQFTGCSDIHGSSLLYFWKLVMSCGITSVSESE